MHRSEPLSPVFQDIMTSLTALAGRWTGPSFSRSSLGNDLASRFTTRLQHYRGRDWLDTGDTAYSDEGCASFEFLPALIKNSLGGALEAHGVEVSTDLASFSFAPWSSPLHSSPQYLPTLLNGCAESNEVPQPFTSENRQTQIRTDEIYENDKTQGLFDESFEQGSFANLPDAN